jgi:hypothetical protein
MCTHTYLGFDPGGVGAFGWCLVQGSALPLTIVACGIEKHAEGATTAAQKAVQQIKAKVIAVGIDAPLFWRSDGDRQIDCVIRKQITARGGKSATVMAVNSLRGACLVQGVMAAMIVRLQCQDLPVTESHPKAILWLLGIAKADNPVKAITLNNLGQYFNERVANASDHERDAALGALSAWAMINQPSGWQNLYLQEQNPISPLNPVPGYWMPI